MPRKEDVIEVYSIVMPLVLDSACRRIPVVRHVPQQCVMKCVSWQMQILVAFLKLPTVLSSCTVGKFHDTCYCTCLAIKQQLIADN